MLIKSNKLLIQPKPIRKPHVSYASAKKSLVIVKKIDDYQPSFIDSELTQDNYFEPEFGDPYAEKLMYKHESVMRMAGQTQSEFFKVRLGVRRPAGAEAIQDTR